MSDTFSLPGLCHILLPGLFSYPSAPPTAASPSAGFGDTVWLIAASEEHLAVVVREAPPLQDTALRQLSQLWHYLLRFNFEARA